MISEQTIQQLDSQGMLQSIDMLAQQVHHAWDEAGKVNVTVSGEIRNIVLFGMGGSALGMDIVNAAFQDELTVPVIIHHGYSVPQFVDEHSFVILSSYSGTTEEVIEAAETVQQRTQQLVIITTGGKLQEIAEGKAIPYYLVEPTYNPCGQPRIAVGYAVTGLLRLLSNAGFIKVTDQDIDDTIHFLDGNRTLLQDDAIALAETVANRIPIFVASEYLIGNAHIVTNQINENGKQFSTYYELPELNHHLLEGLQFPEAAKAIQFICIESNFYHAKNQKRYAVTKEVLTRNAIPFSEFIATARTPLLQTFEVLQWGSYLSFYLAMEHTIDPSPIPWVDFFKNALKRPIETS